MVPPAVALMFAAQVPLLWKFFIDLWSRPQYEFFPILLAAIPFVATVCLRELPAGDLRGGWGVATVVLLASWASLALGGIFYLRWAAPVSTWLMLAGCVWALGGRRLAITLWPVGVLLLLVIPPPGQYDSALLVSLRQLAVACAGRLLDLLNVPQFTHGAVIDIPNDRLMVEEACSGINSLLAVLAFTILLAFWKRLPAKSLLLLLPAAASYVFWANVARIIICAVAKQRYDVDLLTGATHELLGIGLFASCMALVFSTEYLGQRLWQWDEHAEPSAAELVVNRGGIVGQKAWPWCAAALVFVLTGTAVTWRTAGAWRESKLPPSAAFALPTTLAGWNRVDDSDKAPERAEISGRQHQLAQYRRGALLATIGIDYPFYGFHDATTCYALAGWNIEDRADQPPKGDGPAVFDVSLRRPPLSMGTMHFALCDEAGNWWRRPADSGANSGLGLKLRLSRERAMAYPLAQIQVLRVGYDALDAAGNEQINQLFDEAAKSFAAKVKAWHEGKLR
ncbi:MAG: exosortase [Phycisphaerales bacterium]|nr:exosortase [Phycisphaerales bacterium]